MRRARLPEAADLVGAADDLAQTLHHDASVAASPPIRADGHRLDVARPERLAPVEEAALDDRGVGDDLAALPDRRVRPAQAVLPGVVVEDEEGVVEESADRL